MAGDTPPRTSQAGVLEPEAIGTQRLDLSPLRLEHAAEMAAVLSDPALHAFIGGTPDTPAELRARYRRRLAGSPDPAVSWLTWVIVLRSSSCLTGTVQATVSAGERGAGAEVAWMVGTAWQQRGIASEAARALVAWLQRRNVRRVIAHIHPANSASAAVATAAGLAPTAERSDGELRWSRDLRP
ncbi:GNAT family N-acetyltransferase [Streptomonospora sp. PA3]|uniref:GNAT family N-acetyltransferase n=1 Tax=Streptomonospora sp. PA3 TaxID=2607326 RepID=UPI0031BBA403